MAEMLTNLTRETVLAENVLRTPHFHDRLIGLLGRASLSPDTTMWIDRCNSIHTFFMKFPIAAVFVDRDLVVRKIFFNVKPWRLVFPVMGARSVFEFSTQAVDSGRVQVGDQLHVGG